MGGTMRFRLPDWILLALATWALTGCSGSGSPPAKIAGNPKNTVATGPMEAAREPETPLFEDVTARSGIAITYQNGEDVGKHHSILESLGGGAALLDFDNDGLLDVFLTGGGTYEGPDLKTITGLPCALYRNRGGLRFDNVSVQAGVESLAGKKKWFYSHGVAAGDYDRDGWTDLLVTGWGAVALLRNVPVDPARPEAGRQFEDVTDKAGLGQGIDWATSAAFGDLDGDGYPDLYVCQYVDWSWRKNPVCYYDTKTRDVCPPRNFDGLPHRVFRNNARGGFDDVSTTCGLREGGAASSKGLGVVVVDVDGDTKPDIYVANDTVDNFLYLNQSKPGQIRLVEKGLVSGVARDDRGNANGSMGTDAGDPQRTGKVALWVTNYENELPMLYRNDSVSTRLAFSPFSTAAGIGAIGQKYVGWGTGFLDADLDGWEDLFISNGHAIRYPTGKTARRLQEPVLLLNRKGQRFQEANSRLGTYGAVPHLGRGVAFGDLDNDGRVDLVMNHMNEPAAVLRGIGGTGSHWVGLSLVGKGNACVTGARVTWEKNGQKQTRFAKGGGSYASSNDRRVQFGLGEEQGGVVTVVWPGGAIQRFENLKADQYHRIEQGAAATSVDSNPRP